MRKKIIFIPGKNPKPEPAEHIKHLRRCLIEGVSRHSQEIASDILEQDAFELCAWNHDFYQQHLDFSPFLPCVDAVCRKKRATTKDKLFAKTWKIALSRWIYQTGDRFPRLIDLLADDHVKAMLHDTDRYFDNTNGIADQLRQKLMQQMLDCANDCKILLIGHSMGSIIAYDTLYQLSQFNQSSPNKKVVDLLITLGSPLGLKYTQDRLLGYSRTDENKMPSNIKNWHNISARGDLVSVDTTLADDFALMISSGRIDSIVDHNRGIFNWFRNSQCYNFHSSYGYLLEPTTSKIITNWWASHA